MLGFIKHVPVFVESVELTGEEASVYNLAVDGCPEYWANGILVHNCLIYMWRRVDKHRDPRPDTRDEMWRVLDATQDALIGDILRGRR